MGSGKSTVGKALSKAINYTFKDLDSEIEKLEAKSIAAIFSENGEIYFRKKENTALKSIISTTDKIVLATGGGTPCYGNIMDFLKETDDVITIYLKVSLPILTERLFVEKERRPLISHLQEKETLHDFIRKHLFERSHIYNQADIIVNVDEKKTSEIVEELVLKLF